MHLPSLLLLRATRVMTVIIWMIVTYYSMKETVSTNDRTDYEDVANDACVPVTLWQWWWVQPWIERRFEHGAYHALLKELQTTDTKGLRNFLRMDAVSFQILLGKVSQKITKQPTRMRNAISPEERLAVTLRYLATGVWLFDKAIGLLYILNYCISCMNKLFNVHLVNQLIVAIRI